MAIRLYTEVNIKEEEIVDYIAEGSVESIVKFVMKIIQDKWTKEVDEDLCLDLMARLSKQLAKQNKDIAPEIEKKYKEINKLINEVYIYDGY